MSINGIGGMDCASLYSPSSFSSSSGQGAAGAAESLGSVMIDSVELQSEMALKLLQAGAQQQVALQQMEFTEKIVDMYV